MRRLLTSVIITLSAATLYAAGNSASFVPQVHGVIRARYELSTLHAEQRFQVRNARIAVSGSLTKFFDYNVMTDFCDRGKIKILDAWARVNFTPAFQFQMGQFRMPFGVETFRAPQNYLFANRAYMGKMMCNYRAVGAKLAYTLPSAPLSFEAGMFNPNTIGDHTPWHRPMAYSAKVSFSHKNITLSTGFMSITPDSVRSNLVDLAAGFDNGTWLAATEFMLQNYTRKAAPRSFGYVANLRRSFNVKWWEFNRASLQARFDGITRHSSGALLPNGKLAVTTPAANRLTFGGTLSYIHTKNIGIDIRLDYEKMFHHRNTVKTPDNSDRLTLELIARF